MNIKKYLVGFACDVARLIRCLFIFQ